MWSRIESFRRDILGQSNIVSEYRRQYHEKNRRCPNKILDCIQVHFRIKGKDMNNII